MNKHDIVALYVAFSQGNGGKRRPILVVQYDQEGIEFYPLTSKFFEKSKHIKARYYEIEDWKESGLAKPSWIDIGKRLWLPVDKVDQITKIGKLTVNDKEKLSIYLEKYFS